MKCVNYFTQTTNTDESFVFVLFLLPADIKSDQMFNTMRMFDYHQTHKFVHVH